MKVPDLLLCVGAQKSGTTWLYKRLVAHDAFRRASHKEVHYFSTVHCNGLLGPARKMNAMRRMIEKNPERVMRFIRAQATGEARPQDVARVFRPMNDDWYARFFMGSGRYAMDFTPEYARLPDQGHAHIKRISERQKVMFLMRDPLDRALSAVRYSFKTEGRDIAAASLDDILNVARRPIITSLSEYDFTIPMLKRHYAPENLRFFFYETMMREKKETLDAVCDWLEIERLDLPDEDIEARDNSTPSFAMPAPVIDELGEKLAPVRARVEEIFPEARAAWKDVVVG